MTDRHRYADPARRYVAAFATPWRRGAAAAVDWGLCYVIYLIVSIPLGVIEALGETSREDGDLGGVPGAVAVIASQILILSAVAAYWVLLLPTSQTFGMRLMDIRAVSVRTGCGPSRKLAVVRGVCATAIAAAVYIVFLRRTAFDQNELDRASSLVLDGAYVLSLVAAASVALLVLTPSRRSLFDRLFGMAVLDDLEALAPVEGPWGPLNVFDTSHGGAGRAQSR